MKSDSTLVGVTRNDIFSPGPKHGVRFVNHVPWLV
jgi:hypothetical protein